MPSIIQIKKKMKRIHKHNGSDNTNKTSWSSECTYDTVYCKLIYQKQAQRHVKFMNVSNK